MRFIAQIILRSFGWKTELSVSQPDRCVLIGAPHTTNWDFPLTMLALSCMGIRFNWVAKHTLFKWPFGVLFRAIGGIPVDRRAGTPFLMNAIDLFAERSKFILAIAPEGTRSKTQYWKTGFYTIAEKASVPIALGFIDYAKKHIGIGEIITPTGDIARDFEAIQEFYKDKKGKIEENQGEIRIKISKRKKPSP